MQPRSIEASYGSRADKDNIGTTAFDTKESVSISDIWYIPTAQPYFTEILIGKVLKGCQGSSPLLSHGVVWLKVSQFHR